MKTYYLKIRDKFITDIKNRVKKHEYRLASPERMQAKVGDTFVLISNQNKENFVRATIKGIKVYSSWNEALIENWEQDFKNLFPSLGATLKECYKFYPKDEVDRYGIAVFESHYMLTIQRQVFCLIQTFLLNEKAVITFRLK